MDVPWFNTRAAMIVAGLLLFLIAFFALAGISWRAALLCLCSDGGVVAGWLLGTTGIGWLVWRAFAALRPEDQAHPLLSLITCTALGIGTVSLLVLGLGLAGLMSAILARGLIFGGVIVVCILLFQRRNQWDAALWLSRPASFHWLWAALAALFGIAAIGACFPPGALWGDEPNGYDVVEYHLQVPREWFEAGRILPLHHNVFSYFPFNVEMHYLLAMYLRAGPWAGMYVAQLMHVVLCGLMVIAIFALAGGGIRGTVAAALAGAVPWTAILAPMAYNEGGMLLFGTLAIGWALRAKTARQFALAGAMAGLAMGCKLSVAPLLFAALPVALFFAARLAKSQSEPAVPIKSLLPGCAIYLLAALLVLSPWLIRNWVWTHNTVFPEAMTLLGKAHFSDAQAKRWDLAYQPPPGHGSFSDRLAALGNQFGTDPRYGLAFIPLGIAGVMLSGRNRATICLVVLFLMQTIFWLFFTHLQSRFMVMVIPIIALIVAQNAGRDWLKLAAMAGAIMAAFCGYLLVSKLAYFSKFDRKIVHDTGFSLIGLPVLDGMSGTDITQLREDMPLDLVGDARAFLYQIPMNRLHYKTVFDVDTSDPSKTILEDWLAGMPPTKQTKIDVDELRRFARTYYGIAPQAESDQRQRPPGP
jgi:hypothetical protein